MPAASSSGAVSADGNATGHSRFAAGGRCCCNRAHATRVRNGGCETAGVCAQRHERCVSLCSETEGGDSYRMSGAGYTLDWVESCGPGLVFLQNRRDSSTAKSYPVPLSLKEINHM